MTTDSSLASESTPKRESVDRRDFLKKTGLVLASAALPLSFGSSAEAQRVRATAFLTQAVIPRRLSERGLIRFARSHRARQLRETTDQPIPEREWRANLVVSFNRPIGDREFQVLFYDITEGERLVPPPLSVYLNNNTDKTFVQRVQLERPTFQPNRRMQLMIRVRQSIVGRVRFELVGERVRHSGEVNFAE